MSDNVTRIEVVDSTTLGGAQNPASNESLADWADRAKREYEESLARQREATLREREERMADQEAAGNTKRIMEDPYNQVISRIEGRDRNFDRKHSELDALRDLSRDGLLDDEEEQRLVDLTRAIEGRGRDGGPGSVGTALSEVGRSVGGLSGAGMQAAGGAMSGALGAAGIAGAAVAISQMIHAEVEDRVRRIAPAPGQATGAIASLDPYRVTEGANKALEGSGLSGIFAAELNRGLLGAVGDIAGTARKLGPYSGPLATQLGLAEARSTLGDIERAGIMGPALAEFTEAKSKLEQEAMTTLAKLATPLIPMFTRLLQNLLKFLEWFEPYLIAAVNQGIDGINSLIDFAQKVIEFFKIQNFHLKHIDHVLTEKDPLPGDQFLDELLATLSQP